MQGQQEVLELLNEVLTAELTAVNQYFLDAKMFDHWGYRRLGERFRNESIGEMKDADEFIERLNRGIALCVAHSDNGTREILEGEERHADWLATQLGLIAQISPPHYLAQQIDA